MDSEISPEREGPAASPGPWRERVRAATVLGALTLIVYGDVLFRFDGTVVSHPQGDTSLYFAPFREFGFRELAHGNLVLWNPHVFSGAPFLGGFQSALLYPPNLMYIALPLGFALNFDICLHTFLLGYFTFLWVRPWTRRLEPALFAAAILMFSGTYSLRVLAGQLTMLSTLAYAPLLLYAIDRVLEAAAARKPVLGPVLLGVAATSLQIVAGYPGTVFMTAFTAACYCAIRLAGSPRRLFALVPLASIALAPAGITAMQLWVGVETAQESIRAGGGSFEFASSFSFPIENLITLVAPGFFGDNVPAAYWGRWNFWDVSFFVGVAALLFAVAGVIWGRGRGGATALAIGGLILAISLGRYTPLFKLFYDHVPGFQSFRAPSKFLFFSALFLAHAAGLGLDALLAKPSRARWLGWGALGFAAALGAGVAWVLIAQANGGWAHLVESAKHDPEAYIWVETTGEYIAHAARAAVWGLVLAGTAAIAAGGLLILSPRRPRLLLAAAMIGVVEVVAFSRVYRQTFALEPADRPAVRDAYASCTSGERVIDMARFDGRVRNYAVQTGGRALWGYDPVILKRYGEFACFAAGGIMHAKELRDHVFTWGSDPFGVALNLGFNAYTPTGLERGGKFFALLRPRFIVRAPVDPQYREFVRFLTRSSAPLGAAQSRTIVAPEAESVYEIPVYYPEFFFAHEYLIRPATFETLNEQIARGTSFSSTVLLEHEPDPAPGPKAGTGKIAVVGRSTDDITLHVELPSNAILVTSNSYSRGWRAVGLGASARTRYTVMPADYTLMAIPLSAGTHDFRIEYSPVGYRYGRWVSLVSLLGYFATAGVWARRRLRGRANASPAGNP